MPMASFSFLTQQTTIGSLRQEPYVSVYQLMTHTAQELQKLLSDEAIADVPVAVVANKTDLPVRV